MNEPEVSLTTWTRLEPRCRTRDMSGGLEARIHDPLWLLARQWQIGEFLGDDAGSPLSVRVRGHSYPVTRFRPGGPEDSTAATDYDGSLPLEMLVQREPVQLPIASEEGYDPLLCLRHAVDMGQHLLRLLGQSAEPAMADVRAAILAKDTYRLVMPEDQEALDALDTRTRRLLLLSVNRVPDGVRLFGKIEEAVEYDDVETFLSEIGIAPATMSAEALEAAKRVLTTWMEWCRCNYCSPEEENESWKPERMEYQFAVAANLPDEASSKITLKSCDYHGGHLDWYHFDRSVADLGGQAPSEDTEFVTTVVPKGVCYAGMPSPRWWEFEDRDVNFGSSSNSPEDLAGMMLTEFALSYGNDWSVVPVRLRIGTLNRIASAVVTDAFGVRLLIPNAKDTTHDMAYWNMFVIGGGDASEAEQTSPEPFLLLPPSLPRQLLQGEPIEKVLFLRDEGANLAWAVEVLVEGPGGGTLNRAEAWMRANPTAPEYTVLPGADAKYLLATQMPDYWFPLVPKRFSREAGAEEQGHLFFTLGELPSASTNGGAQSLAPQGCIIGELSGRTLREEEVPRGGSRIQRGYQFAHGAGCANRIWIGRRRTAGSGEGSSGLRFDVITSIRQASGD